MIHELLNFGLNPILSLQDLTTFNVQETKGVDITEGVVELRLGEGTFSVTLGLLERDASL